MRRFALNTQPAWHHRVLGNHRSFFTRVSNFPQGSRKGARTELRVPQLSHLGLGFIAMNLNKLTKLVPVCDLVAMAWGTVWLRLKVARLCLSIQPLVYCVAADGEASARFTFGETI